MQLLGLMGSYLDVLDWVGSSVEIDGISPDSDRVLPGHLFVALPGAGEDGHNRVHQALLKVSFAGVIVQILLLDVVFSLDSVITAVGMVDQLAIMIAAVVIAAVVMNPCHGPRLHPLRKGSN